VRRTPAQRRTIAVALELFADHGVSGTSLQMMADQLGVTKAAIYYQFKTKNEIVLAVCEDEFASLEAAVEAAEQMTPRAAARAYLLEHVVDVAIGATVVHPLVADLDDATLRTELLVVARRIFDLPE
jgi:AcrR family transcriptional regulator